MHLSINEGWALLPALAAGVMLGLLFFGGLWWTVRRLAVTAHPALWMLGSFVLRTAIVLAGFYMVADSRWQNLIAALAGFILARILVQKRTGGEKSAESELADASQS